MSLEAAALALVDDISGLVPDQVHVGLSLIDAAAALAAGRNVLVVLAPTINYETWDHVIASWPVWAITHHDDDTDTASWASLGAILTTLAVPLALDSAEPRAFTDAQGNAYPGYLITTTTTL